MGLDRLRLLYSSTLPADVPVPVAVEQIAAVLATGASTPASNWSAEALAAAGREARTLGLAQPCAVQLPYSLAHTERVEDPAMERALADTKASLIPSAVLARRRAERQVRRRSDRPAERRAGFARAPARVRAGAALRAPAQRLGVSPATLAIAFTLRHPRTAATLIGATRTEQIDEAMAAVELAGQMSAGNARQLRELAR